LLHLRTHLRLSEIADRSCSDQAVGPLAQVRCKYDEESDLPCWRKVAYNAKAPRWAEPSIAALHKIQAVKLPARLSDLHSASAKTSVPVLKSRQESTLIPAKLSECSAIPHPVAPGTQAPRPAIPVDRVALIPFIAMQVGMHPRTVRPRSTVSPVRVAGFKPDNRIL
jgi:hypothetical protein